MSAETEGTSTVTASSGSRPSATSVQGIVEIALRAAAAAFAFAALISAAVAVGTVNDLGASGTVVDNVRGASGWIIFIALLAMAIEITFIVLRFLDPEAIRSGTGLSIFLAIDIIISILFALSYFSGAVAAAVFADDFIGTIRSSLGAAAAFSFFSVIVFVALVVLSAVSLLRK